MPRKLVIVSIVCECCHKTFEVKYGERHRRFCTKACATRARPKSPSKKKTSVCVVCNNEYLHYGSHRVVCSRKCNAKYMSEMRLGCNNPAYKDDKDVNFICKNCLGNFTYQCAGHDQPKQFCSRLCWHLFQKGKNKELNGPAVYDTKYPVEFREAKRRVRERDECLCAMCSTYDKNISVHHIDYDKKNCVESNLICLCKRCHGLTNFTRGFWETFFTALISGSKIVRKEWGAEVHMVNHHAYCLKYLVFFEGCHFSHHYHEVKRESWSCLMGGFDMLIQLPSGEEWAGSLNKGDSIEIVPTVAHQLKAKKNSIIMEVSTQSFPEDSFKDKNIVPDEDDPKTVVLLPGSRD